MNGLVCCLCIFSFCNLSLQRTEVFRATSVPMATNTQSKSPQNDPFKLHVAIDFGTDGIGLAYAIDKEVFVHQAFNSRKYGSSVKPKTIVLLDNEGDVNSFGIDAKFMLSLR